MIVVLSSSGSRRTLGLLECEVECTTVLWNAWNCSLNDIVSHAIRLEFSNACSLLFSSIHVFDYFFCCSDLIFVIWFPDTQQADYHVVASVVYRANGAVAASCLAQYSDLLAQYYTSLNHVLTQRCSAVNVNMSVSFVDSKPRLLEENVVQVRYQ